MAAPNAKLEYGDYQTPADLAAAACRVLADLGIRPAALVEPTCGVGTFLNAGLAAFPSATAARGFEINAGYARAARAATAGRACIERADFFKVDWRRILHALPEPILVFGNPPWVTNSALGAMAGSNLPAKTNLGGMRGIDALTGKSNFDISEFMLLRLAEALAGREAVLAMLSKTVVARRVMTSCWKRGLGVRACHILPIDAARVFRAAADACLFVASFGVGAGDASCTVHRALDAGAEGSRIGLRDGLLVSDLDAFERRRGLRGPGNRAWRSGIKHDCAKVMELTEQDGTLVNGVGETVEIEDLCLYPLRKSSDIAGTSGGRRRWMLVPQRATGDDPGAIESKAPGTWRYLLDHAALLDGRRSAIYRDRPRFSIFGVGPYSFAPWKVAISGLHKKLSFAVAGPRAGKPVVFDDTCYFVACETEREAVRLAALLNAPPAQAFYRSLIFWDAKRPITAEILNQLALDKLTSD